VTSDEQEHKRVRTVLDDVADANDAKFAQWMKAGGMFSTERPIEGEAAFMMKCIREARAASQPDTDPRIENGGNPLRIRGMIEDGKLVLPGEPGDD